jgi:hypothetical protein
MGFKLPALDTALGFSIYASPGAAAGQAAWLAASGINATILALKNDPALLAWTVGNEISLGSKSGLSYVTNAATGVSTVRARASGAHARLPPFCADASFSRPRPPLAQWTGGSYAAGWANMWTMVNTITGWIHALDGNHPVGTCTPNINADTVANGFRRFAPNLDFFGANVYGFAALGYVSKVASIIGTTGWNKPYLASEYGMSNWFTSPFPTTPTQPNGWGAYAEDPSAVKAATYAAAWAGFQQGASATAVSVAGAGGSHGLMVGAWAFSYGWIWQASATWVNMVNYYPFTYTAAAGGYDGAGTALAGAWASGNEESEVADALHNYYNTSAPITGLSAAPSIPAPGMVIYTSVGGSPQFGGQNIALTTGSMYTASAPVTSAYAPSGWKQQWLILPIPSGGPTDHTTYAPVLNATGGTGIYSWAASASGVSCTFMAPSTPGAYSLSLWVYDSSNKFATHVVAFNTSIVPSPYIFPTDGDTFSYDAAVYGSQGWNAGYSAATCTTGNEVCWHAANTLQSQGYVNYGNATQLTAQGYRPVGNNRYPYFHFTFPPAGSASWTPSPVSLPGRAFLYVYTLTGDPSFNLTVYGVNAATFSEGNLTYASLGNVSGLPQVVGRPVSGATASGGLQGWVGFDVSDYVLSLASAGATQLAFALQAGSATVVNGFVTTSVMLASRECAAASAGVCTAAVAPGSGNGPMAAYLAITRSTAGVSLQISNVFATSLANAALVSRRRARALLQNAPPAPPPSPVSTAETNIEAIRTQLAATAGGTVTPAQVSVTISSHSVSSSIVLEGARSLDSWSAYVQLAFVTGLALDLSVSPSQIAISFVHDTFDLTGLDVPFSINGFTNATDDGLSAAVACVQALESDLSHTLAAVAAAVTVRVVTRARLNEDPTIYAQVSSALSVDVTQAVLAQSLLTNSVGSGAMENSLRQDGVEEHIAPPNRFASFERDMGLLGCAPAAEVVALGVIAIVFIVYAGVITFCCWGLWRKHSLHVIAAAAGSDKGGACPTVVSYGSSRKLPEDDVAAVPVYTSDAYAASLPPPPPPVRVGSPRRSRAVTPRAGANTPLSQDAALAGTFAE